MRWFQSLGRDSVHSSSHTTVILLNTMSFQSLGRDSVHSSPGVYFQGFRARAVSIPRSGFCSFKPARRTRRATGPYGFNPSVGILFIQASNYDNIIPYFLVSIPRSGFCSFKLYAIQNTLKYSKLFQSLGRDSVHSSVVLKKQEVLSAMFQSLGRDSVHSSVVGTPDRARFSLVSIPRSGFCSFKLCRPGQLLNDVIVSIPRSGFCSFKLGLVQSLVAWEEFQSLGRDSVHSSGSQGPVARIDGKVSIPRSGFCSFKLGAQLGCG